MREKFIIILTSVLIGLNGLDLLSGFPGKSGRQKPVAEPGNQFTAFADALKDAGHAGFLTNKDLRAEKNYEPFLQAQYRLAPTVLQLNEIHPGVNILDYTKPVWAIYTLKSLRAEPRAATPDGQVLAVRQP